MLVSDNEAGSVVIGRNEGHRLIHCLESLVGTVNVVYVDSGSTDGSVVAANAMGVTVVELDMQQPFTAARARNAGAQKLLEMYPETEFIQFVDGDCEVVSGWLEIATQFLLDNADFAMVCGRRRERFPQNSLYNQLCDIEWDTPIGDAKACGGDALIRLSAFKQVEGYRDSMIAGEEPEMCYRMRHAGWKIFRMDAEMTLHDAAMSRFSQWWKRNKRAGHAYAENLYLHHKGQEKFRARKVLSILLWALVLPLVIALAGLVLSGSWLLMVLIYPIQVLRLCLSYWLKLRPKNALLYACSNVFGQFAQLSGVMSFALKEVFSKDSVLIEYK